MTHSQKDRLTPEMLSKMPLKKQVSLLNSRIHYYFQTNNLQRHLRFDEKHVINDFDFQKKIQTARQNLGVVDFLDFNDYQQNPQIVQDWLARQVFARDEDMNDNEYDACLKKITSEISRIINDEVLPAGWFDYLMAYVALGEKPVDTEVERDPLVYVEAIEHDELVIRMEKGLKPEDYAVVWKALKPFFRQPSRLMPSTETLKGRVYTARKKGLGISAIAKRYFPDDYEKDPPATRDKVKKIITRFKQ